MNRAAVIASSAFAISIFTACSEALAPAGPETDTSALTLQPATMPAALPLRGDFTWEFDGWTLPPSGRCPAGLWFLSALHGTGTLTHTGRVVATGGHCVDPFTLAFVSGFLMLTAANGDGLFMTYEGTSFAGTGPGEVGWTDVVTVTGGTGRFAGAEGTGDEIGMATVTFDPGTGLVTGGSGRSTVEGTIRYDASNRRH